MRTKISKRIMQIAIIGFFSISSYSQNLPVLKSGKDVFEFKCVACHGIDGTKGKWGAINLQRSYLDDIEILKVISNGRRIMPSWKKKLTLEEIKSVILYIKTLRK
ncbi:cytochrome c [Flavobacterium sp. JAS]|uniref:c-type cytochrome n=1 Tax=Flavobacterium sp. JAS TaxID=2897329 RepID=UPI001E55718B|nr:cytochrome c [Flavobacterium sp. JAS]MCD0470350.1 cytochrome c [Flavobacterium sp. JAS]